jgi:hypothetical protein
MVLKVLYSIALFWLACLGIMICYSEPFIFTIIECLALFFEVSCRLYFRYSSARKYKYIAILFSDSLHRSCLFSGD